MATVAAGVSFWLDLYWWDLGFGPIAPIGIGVGVVLGFISGPDAVATPRPAIYALAVAVKAALLGLAVLCALLPSVAGWSTGGAGGASLEVVLFALFGVLPALALALPVTTPIAFLTTGALRLATRRPAAGGVAIAVILVSCAVSTGVALVVPRPDPTVAAVDFAPVHVEWTVANRSTRSLQLGVFDRDGDRSFGGLIAGIEPCYITTERDALGVDWFLTLEPHPGDATELVGAEQAPGDDVRVWIDVAPDGEASVELDREAPSAEELTVDLCTQDTGR